MRTRRPLLVFTAGRLSGRSGEPVEHGLPREAPMPADLAARKLTRLRRRLHIFVADLEEVCELIDGQDVSFGRRSEAMVANRRAGFGTSAARGAAQRYVKVARNELGHDFLLWPPQQRSGLIKLFGLLLRNPGEERRCRLPLALYRSSRPQR